MSILYFKSFLCCPWWDFILRARLHLTDELLDDLSDQDGWHVMTIGTGDTDDSDSDSDF